MSTTSKNLNTAGAASSAGGALASGLAALGVAAGPLGWLGLGLGALGTTLGLFGGKKKAREEKKKAIEAANTQASNKVGSERLAAADAKIETPAPAADAKTVGANNTAAGLNAVVGGVASAGNVLTSATKTDPNEKPDPASKAGAGEGSNNLNDIQKAANTNATLNTVGNVINAGSAIMGLVGALNADPVKPIQPMMAKAPKAPELVEDNTEAVRAQAESKVEGNLGAAEKGMLEMGVNPAMVQSIKTSQGNQASVDINANLAQNKLQINANNANTVNQNNQLETQVSSSNAQIANQVKLTNSQRQAMANQGVQQSMFTNLAALTNSMSNIGKGKLDKALYNEDMLMRKKLYELYGIK